MAALSCMCGTSSTPRGKLLGGFLCKHKNFPSPPFLSLFQGPDGCSQFTISAFRLIFSPGLSSSPARMQIYEVFCLVPTSHSFLIDTSCFLVNVCKEFRRFTSCWFLIFFHSCGSLFTPKSSLLPIHP